MKISVVMPVFNETIKELHESINSILIQTYTNFEFIIVDDNPKSCFIKNYLIEMKNRDQRIKLIFNKIHIGSMLSANKALKVSTGMFVARMDADDISNHNRLWYQLHFCLKYSLDLSCCNYKGFSDRNINEQSSYPNITQVNQQKMRRVMSYFNIATGPTLFFRRNILNKIGAYRNMLCEDYDLATRALVYNYTIGYLSYSLIYKRCRSNNLSSPNALKEFIICRLISKCNRLTKFTKIISLPYIKHNVDKIGSSNKRKYLRFIRYSKLYDHTGGFTNLLKKCFYAFSSLLMLKRTVMIHYSRLIQYLLLKY